MKTKIFLAVAGALIVAGAGCAASQPGGENTQPAADYNTQPQTAAPADTSAIKVGWVGPLTGDAASVGQDALKAAQLAVEEVNAAGGVNGRNYELIA